MQVLVGITLVWWVMHACSLCLVLAVSQAKIKCTKMDGNRLSVHACRQIQIYSNLTKLKLLIRIKQIYLTGGVEMLVSSVRGARTTVAVQKQENMDILLLRKLR